MGLPVLRSTEKPVKKYRIAGKINYFFASVFTTVGAGKMSTSQLLFTLNLIQKYQKRGSKARIELVKVQLGAGIQNAVLQ